MSLFYYFDENNWCFSNSYYMLQTYMKNKKVKLTPNINYINWYLCCSSVMHSVEHTFVEEIKNLPRFHELHINFSTKQVFIKKNNLCLYNLDNEQGLEFIDKWYIYWKNIISLLVNSGNYVNTQLSGGFDSRCTFSLFDNALFSKSNVNLESSNSVRYKEDLEIAEEISNYYNIRINSNITNFEYEQLKYEFSSQMITLAAYGQEHHLFSPSIRKKYSKPYFVFNGCYEMRKWFNGSFSNYKNVVKSTIYQEVKENKLLRTSVEKSIDYLLNQIVDYVGNDVYKNYNFSENELLLLSLMYGRGRVNHSPVFMAYNHVNQYYLTPIADFYVINPLSFPNKQFNFLYAYIWQRFNPKLLDFRFNKNRIIENTLLTDAKSLAQKRTIRLDYQYDNINIIGGIMENNNEFISEKDLTFSKQSLIDYYKKGSVIKGSVIDYVGREFIENCLLSQPS